MTQETSERRSAPLATVLQFAQLVVLVVGVAGVFLAMGRRDATLDSNSTQISELRSICSDLARVTGSLSVTDASHTAQLRAIETRIDRLESR